MSEPTLQLPSELKYGYVEAQIILAVADTAADPDRLPDAQPASGTITLTPVESKRLYTQSGSPVLVGKHPISGSLDTQGRLRDSQGGLGLCVVVGQYRVSYSLQGVSVDSHNILVTEDHVETNPLNLVDLVTFDPPATPGQFELLNARIDAESVIDKAPVMVLTNPEEIPTDVAGRIDLVFTEPTTVHFQSPVRTDIVVSIEGYNYITWEGVAVHGTPVSSGVVWASAMWRDRDSTWHLLCEQDYEGSETGGPGGSVTTERVMVSGFRNSTANSPLVASSNWSLIRTSTYDPVVGTVYFENSASRPSFAATYAPADHPGLTFRSTLRLGSDPGVAELIIQVTVVAADWPASPPAFGQTVVWPQGQMPDVMLDRTWAVDGGLQRTGSTNEATSLLGGILLGPTVTNGASGPGLTLFRIKMAGSAPTEDRTVIIEQRLVGTPK